jgi:hypothetical protein
MSLTSKVEAVGYHKDKHTMFLKQPAGPLAFGIGECSVLTVTHERISQFPSRTHVLANIVILARAFHGNQLLQRLQLFEQPTNFCVQARGEKSRSSSGGSCFATSDLVALPKPL